MRYRSTGDAIGELEAMPAATPENFKLRNALGESYVHVQHYEKAKALYQGAFDYDKKGPASLAARNKLAELPVCRRILRARSAGSMRSSRLPQTPPDALITQSRIKLREGDYKEVMNIKLINSTPAASCFSEKFIQFSYSEIYWRESVQL